MQSEIATPGVCSNEVTRVVQKRLDSSALLQTAKYIIHINKELG